MAFLRQAQLDPASREREKPPSSIRKQQPIVPKAPEVNVEPDFGAKGVTATSQFDPLGNEYTRTLRSAQGGYGELVTAQPQTTDTPEQVQEAIGGVEARSDERVQNIVARQEQAEQAQGPTTADQIKGLEEQLATPGRGLRQSFGDLLTEQQGRKNLRTQLDNLYSQQKTETAQAGQTERAAGTSLRAQQNADRTYQLAVAKFNQSGSQADQASRRRAFEDARNVHTDFAKEKYKDEPDKQQAYVAKQLAAKDPNFLASPEGQGYTRQIKKDVVESVRSERGLFDAIFGDASPSQGDIESFSFKGWKIGDAGPWFGDPTVAKKGQSGNYAYLDNMSDEQVWVLEQLIRQDNPEDYPDAKREGIRTGQQ